MQTSNEYRVELFLHSLNYNQYRDRYKRIDYNLLKVDMESAIRLTQGIDNSKNRLFHRIFEDVLNLLSYELKSSLYYPHTDFRIIVRTLLNEVNRAEASSQNKFYELAVQSAEKIVHHYANVSSDFFPPRDEYNEWANLNDGDYNPQIAGLLSFTNDYIAILRAIPTHSSLYPRASILIVSLYQKQIENLKQKHNGSSSLPTLIKNINAATDLITVDKEIANYIASCSFWEGIKRFDMIQDLKKIKLQFEPLLTTRQTQLVSAHSMPSSVDHSSMSAPTNNNSLLMTSVSTSTTVKPSAPLIEDTKDLSASQSSTSTTSWLHSNLLSSSVASANTSPSSLVLKSSQEKAFTGIKDLITKLGGEERLGEYTNRDLDDPITFVLMKDPVIGTDLKTYNRSTLEDDIRPITNNGQRVTVVIPNMDRRNLILNFLEQKIMEKEAKISALGNSQPAMVSQNSSAIFAAKTPAHQSSPQINGELVFPSVPQEDPQATTSETRESVRHYAMLA